MSRSYIIPGLVSEGKTIIVDSRFYNWIATATYYSDEYITPVTPSAGTMGVLGTVVGAGGAGLFADSPLDCTDVTDFASAGFPLESITSAPVGITGATHYRLTITGTEG
jgi:hypothetical protein